MRGIISVMCIHLKAPRHTPHLRRGTFHAVTILESRTQGVRNLCDDDSKMSTYQMITPRKGFAHLLQQLWVPVGTTTITTTSPLLFLEAIFFWSICMYYGTCTARED